MLEFCFSIILNDPAEQENVKAFVKEYYSCFDCIDENVDSSSGSKSVCAECLGIDGDDLDFVCDSLFTGDFAKSLAVQGFKIKSLGMSIEEIGIAAGTFEDGKINYREIFTSKKYSVWIYHFPNGVKYFYFCFFIVYDMSCAYRSSCSCRSYRRLICPASFF